MDPVLPQSYAPGNGMAIKDTKSFGVGFDFEEHDYCRRADV